MNKEKQWEVPWSNGKLQVAENNRFLKHENGVPFFWLGDTGWLLFQRLTSSEAETYLEDRQQKGFNVIQAMVLHKIPESNVYGKNAFIDMDISRPDTKETKPYGYWEHVDYIIDKAAKKGIYIALVPAWGSIVKQGFLNISNADTYGQWLASRYKDKPNIFWIIGGDTKGGEHTDVWNMLAYAIKKQDKSHLMTFHPFGRMQSSTWFHSESWLDFNMFQSGHRRYDQMDGTEDQKGEDNWRYVQEDYAKLPPKPTLDGEPSYEGIPQGLHDPNEPYWTACDCRRYAYWSVFAGAFGHTYGHSAVMQMHKPEYGEGSYGVKKYWYEAMNDEGVSQMKYLKQLIVSVPFFERIPDPSIINGDEGERYDHLAATRGKDYLFVYTYTGRKFTLAMGKISGRRVNAWWFNPRNGELDFIGTYENSGVQEFNPPGEKREGNDWVIIVVNCEAADSSSVPSDILKFTAALWNTEQGDKTE